MSAVTARRSINGLKRAVALGGQTVTITHSDVDTEIDVMLALLPVGTKYEWFRSADTTGWDMPAYLITIPGDYADVTEGDAVVLPSGEIGTGHTVRRVRRPGLAGVTVRTELMVARDHA